MCSSDLHRMRMVSLDAIISGESTQQFLDQLKMISSPKMAKNTHFFHTLPRLSARSIFWVFTHRSDFDGIPVIILEKTKNFLKTDIQSFPTSYHRPRFNIEKASKNCRQVRGLSADIFLKYFCKK